MKQLIDKEHTEAIIKITKVREHFKHGNGIETFKDKLICIKIDKNGWESSTCFKDNKKGARELIAYIKEVCYLK